MRCKCQLSAISHLRFATPALQRTQCGASVSDLRIALGLLLFTAACGLAPDVESIPTAITLEAAQGTQTTAPSSTPAHTSTFAPTPSPSLTPSPTPAATATPTAFGGGSGEIASGGTSGIYLINAEDASSRLLVAGANEGFMAPVWSPDGSKLLVWGFQLSNFNWDVYLGNADGTGLVLLGRGSSPSWSPDGQRIAYSYYGVGPDNQQANHQIYTVKLDGSGLSRLTAESNRFHLCPSWSPDGSRIAYQGMPDRFNNLSEIYSMQFDGTDVVQLTEDRIDDVCPIWSPDGSRIAFLHGYTDNWQIYTMEPGGSDPVQVTSQTYPVSASSLTWSPDSTQIAFIASNWYGNQMGGQVFVVDSSGGDPILIAEGVEHNYLSWKP